MVSVCPGLEPQVWCIIPRWPAPALWLTNGPSEAAQDSIHHSYAAVNVTQTGTCAHMHTEIHTHARRMYVQSWPPWKAKKDQVLIFQHCLGNKKNRKVGHIRGEHTSCVSCQCLSTVIGSIPSPVRSFVSWQGSHLLPFALSVKPLIPPIHLPEPAALSPSNHTLFPSPSLPA